MAPVIPHVYIPDLRFSSLELDARSTKAENSPATSLIKRDFSDATFNPLLPRVDELSSISPMEAYHVLTARDAAHTPDPNPGAGSIDPNDINMQGIQALFAIIGVVFVLGGIWFFFWAKNGGFKWRKGDWDEYKSTVLRRKGPNGTTLSNATKSTILGGGSVVGEGYSDKDSASRSDGMTEAMTETGTVMSSEAPIIKEKQSKKKKETAKEKKVREQNEAAWEGGHDNDVRAYRYEKPARVGGLNKDSDAQFYGTDYSQSDPAGSDTYSNSNRQTSSRQHSPDKRQSRRDFSYGQEENFNASTPPPPPVHAPSPAPRPARYHSPEKNRSPQRPIRQVPGSLHVPGSYAEPLDFDGQSVQSQNTKSYHHPLPSLSGQPQAKTGGYRRDRRDSLDD